MTAGVKIVAKGTMIKNHSIATKRDFSEEKKLSLVNSAAMQRSPVTKRMGMSPIKKRASALKKRCLRLSNVFFANEPLFTDWKAAAGATKNSSPKLNRQRRREPKINKNGAKEKITLKKAPTPGISFNRKKRPSAIQKRRRSE